MNFSPFDCIHKSLLFDPNVFIFETLTRQQREITDLVQEVEMAKNKIVALQSSLHFIFEKINKIDKLNIKDSRTMVSQEG